MLFNSLTFIFVFLPATFAAFYVARSRGGPRSAIALLAVASFVFYAAWKPELLILLLGSIAGNYWVARRLWNRPGNRTFLALGVTGNLLVLGYFKYAGFLATTVADLFADGTTIPEVILPIGISFFTFQQIAYLVEVYRGRAQRASLMHYALFVSFFPQLIAGPIVYHREMLPQLTSRNMGFFSWRNVAVGSSVFVFGLAQKVLLADTLAQPADVVFAAASSGGDVLFLEAWAGVAAFTFQIYFDFAGYSNMAIGLAALFGLRLPINFDSPYRATSIVDFWRRWHITLSRFLREFLYIPLGGNRKGPGRRYVNLIVTMVLGGLWHGAGWSFAFWGLLHGMYLMVNHAWTGLGLRYGWWPKLPAHVSWGVTFASVVLAWVYFRAESIGAGTELLATMLGIGGITLPYSTPFQPELPGLSYSISLFLSLRGGTTPLLIIAMAVALMPSVQQMMGPLFPSIERTPRYRGRFSSIFAWRPSPGWALATMLMGTAALFLIFARAQAVEFVYFQF